MTPTARNSVMSILIAALAAIAVQPLVFFAWAAGPSLLSGAAFDLEGSLAVALLVLVVAAPVVLFIGIPAAVLLNDTRHRGRWLALVGFTVIALPIAGLMDWPLISARHLIAPVIGGLHGLVGALAFHWTWRTR